MTKYPVYSQDFLKPPVRINKILLSQLIVASGMVFAEFCQGMQIILLSIDAYTRKVHGCDPVFFADVAVYLTYPCSSCGSV